MSSIIVKNPLSKVMYKNKIDYNKDKTWSMPIPINNLS